MACEGPGTLIDAVGGSGLACRTLRPWAGDEVPPSLEGTDGLVVLGGPMSVNDGSLYPFLPAEENLVREAIGRDLPTVGICLGSQMIARVAGARVTKGPAPEIGWREVRLEPAARDDPLLGRLDSPLPVFQWHAETFDLPRGAELLATSETYPNQAFRLGRNVHAFQFHLEVTAWMLNLWCRIYADELTEEASRAMRDQIHPRTLRLRDLSKIVFGSFARSVGGSKGHMR